MKKAFIFACCIACALVLFSCDAGSLYTGNSVVTVEIQPLISNSESFSSSRAVLSLTNQTVTLTVNSEGSGKSQNLTYDAASGVYNGSVMVKTGSSCTFTVECKDSEGNVYVKGTSQKKVETPSDSVSITLAPVISTEAKTVTSPFFQFPFDAVKTGQVSVVKFAPVWNSSIVCYPSALYDALFVVCDESGNTLSSGSGEWTMAPGSVVYLLISPAAEDPLLVVWCDIPLVDFSFDVEDPGKPFITSQSGLTNLQLTSTLQLTASPPLLSIETYDEYKWILKNRVLKESSGPSISLLLSDHSDLIIYGENSITLAYRKGSLWYSAVITFTVAEKGAANEK